MGLQSIDGKKIVLMRSTKKIFICGFMGAGKSTFLRKFSGSDLILMDLDELILSKGGRENLGDYIEEIGWERFRELEFSQLGEILKTKERMMISLGGGSLSENFWNLLKKDKKNLTVWLKTPFEECLRRISSSKDRPLVKNGEAYLKALYEERLKDYENCDIALNQNEQESIKNIKDLISLMPPR
jgi:shikimate kinase